ncbi:MAG: hypothetical protein H0X66_12260 [Verrucomicrobia bacterium]|nr:hypothetical protein [Verrucomicrobiota bacterium]
MKTELKHEQESLEALLAAMQNGADAGLAQLEGKTDPASTRRRLVILLQAERNREAADIVRDQQPHEQWIELAIQAFGSNGERDNAERVFLVSQKLKNRIKCDKCRLTFAEVLFRGAFAERKPGSSVSPYILTEAERLTLAKVREVLMPLLLLIEANKHVETELDQTVVELGLKVSHLLGEKLEPEKLADLLATRTPVSMLLGEAVLARWIKMPKDLPGRLQRDHPKSFEAKIMAALLLNVVDGKPDSAFELAKGMVGDAKDEADKVQLFRVLDSLADDLSAEESESAKNIALQLLPQAHFQVKLLKANNLQKQGYAAEARLLLEEIRDENDVQWLQRWADINLQSNNGEEAFRALQRAVEVFPHPEIYERAAQVAITLNELAEATQLIQQQLFFEPENVRARWRLATILGKQQKYHIAAEHFAVLQTLQPEEPSHAFNRALSLEQAGDSEGSLNVYEVLCKSIGVPVEAYIRRAGLLKAKNKPEAAFEGLQAVRQQYWDHPGFVGAFLEIAHAAQKDMPAHEALLRLQQLQDEGKIEGALRQISLDEVKGHADEFREKRESLLRFSIEGKVPWLAVEQMLGRVPYWGWFLRTQPIGWLGDDPLVCAEFTIYSTNGFYVRRRQDKGSLEEIECSQQGEPVAVDLTALLTLHRLGLLEKAAQYFGRLLIPSAYVQRILDESSRLVLHQKSQKTSLVEIKKCLDGLRIKVLEAEASKPEPFPYLSEYAEEKDIRHSYKIRDVAEVLRAAGQISDSKYSEVFTVAHRPSTVDHEHPALKHTQSLVAELSTLKTLQNVGVLEAFIKYFDVHISSEGRDELLRDVRGIEALEEVYTWHSQMWEQIRSDARFVQIPHAPRTKRKTTDDDVDREVYLSAYLLAKQEKVPLFADDRACQTIAFNENKGSVGSVFGTDKLLHQLAASGLIRDDEFADAYLKLISWRYRFLMPPSAVLLNLTKRYLSNPPGKPLREIAHYVHDCMRDAGLIAGFEPTDPPASVAVRSFLQWVNTIAQFLVHVGNDVEISEEKADAITTWAIHELLPSPPKMVGQLLAEAISAMHPRSVISQALICLLYSNDHERGNKTLRRIARNLGLSEQDYSRFLAEVINAV